MATLVLLRHGESTANQEGVYTGWNDVPLTDKGRRQAEEAGHILAATNFTPSQVHTSVLIRAITTANIVMNVCGFLYLPLFKSWRLNERHYGALRGLNKEDTKIVFGQQQVRYWRRGFTSLPPLLGSDNHDRRYKTLDPSLLPRSESLQDTQRRVLSYYFAKIAPQLRRGRDQLVVAHGSSIRVLIKYLEDISDGGLNQIVVPNAKPIIYRMDDQLKIIDKS